MEVKSVQADTQPPEGRHVCGLPTKDGQGLGKVGLACCNVFIFNSSDRRDEVFSSVTGPLNDYSHVRVFIITCDR